MTLGGRLAAAITEAGVTRKELGHMLKSRGVVGVSYPAMKRYLDNEVEPTLGFIRESAGVLNVSPSWLGFGVGPMRVMS